MTAVARRWAEVGVAAFVLMRAVPAVGAEYECFIDVEAPDDLRALRAEGRISEATLQTLLPLLESPVDLRRAPPELLRRLPNLTAGQVRVLLRRRRAGAPLDLAALTEEGVLPPDAATALRPFVRPSAGTVAPGPWRGGLRLRAGLLPGDRRVPAAALEGRVARQGGWSAGLALVLARLRPGAVTAGAAGWTAAVPTPRPVLASAWIEGQVRRLRFVAGSFRLGFGHGLTFDTTGRYAPEGAEPVGPPAFGRASVRACRLAALPGEPSPCAGAARFARTADDPDWGEGLRGVALDRLPLGAAGGVRLDVSLWASLQRRDLYQYQVVDRSRCTDGDCASPTIQAEGAEAAGALAWATLPDAFDEALAGFHLALGRGRPLTLGLTAWTGRITWRLPGRPDFKAWAPWPTGARALGALGVDGALVLPSARAWAEAAVGPSSTAGAPEAAGAALLGIGFGGGRPHAEISLRYFGAGWANPHGSPPAAPDRVDGFRARDEAGARMRFSHRWGSWRLRARGDVWGDARLADPGATGALTLARGLGGKGRGWVEAAGAGGAPRCAGGAEAAMSNGALEAGALDAVCRSRSRVRLTLGVSLEPLPGLRVRSRWTEAWPEGPAPTTVGPPVRDRAVHLETSARAGPGLGLRFGLHWLDASVGDRARGETALLTSLEAAWGPTAGWRVSLRTDLRLGLDARQSTLLRTPRPEVQLWTVLERRGP